MFIKKIILTFISFISFISHRVHALICSEEGFWRGLRRVRTALPITSDQTRPLAAAAAAAAARDSDDHSSSDIDHQAGDILKDMRKEAVPVALFEAATSAALFINAVEPLHFYCLVAPYYTLLYLSLFISMGLAIYFIMDISNTGSTHNTSCGSISDAHLVLVLRMLVWTGIITITLALVLRGLMVQSYSSLKLSWFLFFVIVIVVGLIFLYMCMAWNKKKRNYNINREGVLSDS